MKGTGKGNRDGRLELFEALYYEFVLRQKDIRKAIEDIQLNDEFREQQNQKVSEQYLELSKEVKTLKQMQKIRTYRQKGNFIDEAEIAPADDEVYDMIIDLALLTQVSKEGWKIYYNNNNPQIKRQYIRSKDCNQSKDA